MGIIVANFLADGDFTSFHGLFTSASRASMAFVQFLDHFVTHLVWAWAFTFFSHITASFSCLIVNSLHASLPWHSQHSFSIIYDSRFVSLFSGLHGTLQTFAYIWQNRSGLSLSDTASFSLRPLWSTLLSTAGSRPVGLSPLKHRNVLNKSVAGFISHFSSQYFLLPPWLFSWDRSSLRCFWDSCLSSCYFYFLSRSSVPVSCVVALLAQEGFSFLFSLSSWYIGFRGSYYVLGYAPVLYFECVTYVVVFFFEHFFEAIPIFLLITPF